VLSYGLLGEISLKEFLRACLAACRFIQRTQVSCGRVPPASKAVLNGDDKPVIRFSTNAGASGRGAFHGCNQMRVLRLAHKTSSSRMGCNQYFGALARKHDKCRCAKRNIEERSEMGGVRVTGTEHCDVE
jgi:hypothetical protein